jgi:3-phenylpropionate/trans-cinnamate dioxygenase ferredoxin reductase component
LPDIRERIAIVGASAAGVSVVEALRQQRFPGSIVLLGAEPHLPYDRPPLSKQILAGHWLSERLTLRNPQWYMDMSCELELGVVATGLDLDRREIQTDHGGAVRFDKLVIATGVRPRTLPQGHELAGVLCLRTLDDALAARDALARKGGRIAVIGGGFVGSEIAASARSLGHHVTMIYPERLVLELQLGPVLARAITDVHIENGVRLNPGTGVAELTGSRAQVTGVLCHDGTHIPADVVFVCIGSTPATEWLRGADVTVDDGVRCDAYCCAAPGVYAAGDVARWEHPELGASVRVEHRMNAIEQGAAVAANLAGQSTAFRPVPFFWTDQYDHRIQVYGFLGRGGALDIVSGSVEQRRFVGRWISDGRTVGVVGWNDPKRLRQTKDAMLAPAQHR